MDGLTEGRLCHYVAYNDRHLAAIVIGTGVINLTRQGESATDFILMSNVPVADLAVFTNMKNSAGNKNYGLQFHTDVRFSENKEPGTWHWIEPVVDPFSGQIVHTADFFS